MWFLFSKFKRKKWVKYSNDKRFKILKALEDHVANKLKIEPIKLELVYDADWRSFGAFSATGKDRKILINVNLLDNPKLRFHAMETIAHETRHAYQYGAVSRKLKWYEFTAKKWKRNWAGYFSSDVDKVMYNNQILERDAQKYSIKFLRKHSYKDSDYYATLEAVLYRYEEADNEARKKYGIFYKQKIDKNIKNNSRY